MTTSPTLHPTPQFTRPSWTDLSGTWGFAIDDDDIGTAAGWADPTHELGGTIRVPYPPESELSGIADTGFHRVLWYRTVVHLTAERPQAGERLLLHAGAVDYRCEVFINGLSAGRHEGGMTPFTLDLTDLLTDATEQVITLRVEDDPLDLAQPRGKQDWRETTHGVFYQRTSGIWQPIWLERVPARHLSHLDWETDLTAGTVTAELALTGPRAASEWARIDLRHDETIIASTQAVIRDDRARVLLDLPILRNSMECRDLLWHPDRPTLIDATVTLGTAEGEIDVVDSYLGLRSFAAADGGFRLNGQPYFLRMVLEQGYWPQSHLAAPSCEALRREVELIKQLGFNGARLHQKVEDPRFLYWCDRLGLLVWGEMAATFVYTEESRTRLLREWPEVLRRDRSHPSIVAWVPMNESWGVAGIADDAAQRHFASTMYHLTKAIDPTRPTMSNEGWEYTESDIWGVHDYTPSGDSIRARYTDDALPRTLRDRGPGRRRVLLQPEADHGQPVMITEFGGISYLPDDGRRWFGYSTVDGEQDFLDRLRDLVTAITDQPGLAGFCYTQLTDTAQEINGLLRADRTPKLPMAAVREIVTTPARSIPSQEVDAYRRRVAASTAPRPVAGTPAE